ncbi:hypothetical protein PR202_gb12976 [Eleusine coracana subsp. coracana]|uniref:Uncharacterized protein n=1 Tax=Eleusine coracana subsp. coracana TaxID=191504 RepID=A0AAV5ERV8_ELECO|nr:hypothetical protein PR202_gb12976 [Eleusine coracana subsp. coracana]
MGNKEERLTFSNSDPGGITDPEKGEGARAEDVSWRKKTVVAAVLHVVCPPSSARGVGGGVEDLTRGKKTGVATRGRRAGVTEGNLPVGSPQSCLDARVYPPLRLQAACQQPASTRMRSNATGSLPLRLSTEVASSRQRPDAPRRVSELHGRCFNMAGSAAPCFGDAHRSVGGCQ